MGNGLVAEVTGLGHWQDREGERGRELEAFWVRGGVFKDRERWVNPALPFPPSSGILLANANSELGLGSGPALVRPPASVWDSSRPGEPLRESGRGCRVPAGPEGLPGTPAGQAAAGLADEFSGNVKVSGAGGRGEEKGWTGG